MEKITHSRLFDTLSKKMVWGFIFLITIGTVLLSLPIATNGMRGTAFINTLFTATSATCITGLTVVNTAEHWSFFGQVVILGLSEIGALGYMTFAVLLFNIIRRNLDLSTQLMVKESLNLENLSDTKSVMRYVVGLSALFQLGGACLLTFDFIPRYGWKRGLYASVYHAVMSFCNAGFDIFGNSLMGFRDDSYLLIVTIILIIGGGLGFLVWRDLLLYHERTSEPELEAHAGHDRHVVRRWVCIVTDYGAGPLVVAQKHVLVQPDRQYAVSQCDAANRWIDHLANQ